MRTGKIPPSGRHPGEGCDQRVGDGGDLSKFVVTGNFPNPFNPSTTIRYAVPRAVRVRLAIFDPQGRRVCTLRDEMVNGPAWHKTQWDGTDSAGRRVSSGVYFFRLDAGEFSETKRMVLVI